MNLVTLAGLFAILNILGYRLNKVLKNQQEIKEELEKIRYKL